MDSNEPETCEECGFDSDAWTVRDAWTLFDALGLWWRGALAGVPHDALNTRPSPHVWSVLEYGRHSTLVTRLLRRGIEAITAKDGVALPMPPPEVDAGDEGPANLDLTFTVEAVEREAAALAQLARHAPAGAWVNHGMLGVSVIEAKAALMHAVHDATHHQMDVGRGLAILGVGTPPGTGRIVQISVSNGGVPKRPIDRAVVSHSGLVGDRQAERKHHGRPFQALCLWSEEVIDELAALGHGVAPGLAGENLTLAGFDWASLRPGTRLRVGTVLAEVSYPATPCAKQTRWFLDGDFGLIDYERNPHWVRWYAWVREPGEIAVGDLASLQA